MHANQLTHQLAICVTNCMFQLHSSIEAMAHLTNVEETVRKYPTPAFVQNGLTPSQCTPITCNKFYAQYSCVASPLPPSSPSPPHNLPSTACAITKVPAACSPSYEKALWKVLYVGGTTTASVVISFQEALSRAQDLPIHVDGVRIVPSPNKEGS